MRRSLLFYVMVLCSVFIMLACTHTHEFGEWTVKKAATCTEDGINERTCKCGEAEIESIPAIGHVFSEWEEAKPATCTEKGERKRTCKICLETETEEISVSGHVFGEWEEAKPATCTESGERRRVCNKCSETETEEIAAIGHSFVDATLFAPKTCSVCGVTEGNPLGTSLSIGDEAEADEHKIVLSDIYFDDEIYEGNQGFIPAMTPGLIIKLKFTNLGTSELYDANWYRLTNAVMKYDGKYEYRGTYCIINSITPLDTRNLYVYYGVPKTLVSDDGKSMVATFTIDGIDYVVTVR